MSGNRKQLIVLYLMQQLLLLQGAKILTLCFLGGSHYLLMDKASRIFHDHGHEVKMFNQFSKEMLPGYNMQPSPYQVITSSFDEDYSKEFDEFTKESQNEYLRGRSGLHSFLAFMGHLSYQCKIALNRSDILNSLSEEKYDIAVIDAFNPCSFLVAEKIGIPYIAFFPGFFMNAIQIGIPTPLSYVPLFMSHLTNRMDFFERLKNTFMYFGSLVVERNIQAIFDDAIKEHFPAESRPYLSDLYLKAELWIYNTDFAIDFARPLLPHVQYIGGLMAKPAKPVSQDLEEFISQSGESGFIVVTLGSMIASLSQFDILKEMNSAFAKIPQKVIWRYMSSEWPKELELAPNVKIMDWVAQNDLLGHPKIRLLVTHGGMNSLMEAIYHGVPVVGVPLFGDQYDNLVRIKAKNVGTFITADQLRAESLANTMKRIIKDKSYKMSMMHLSVIQRSHPFPPDQKLLRWVEHIIQSGGGDHLKPYSFHQPWYQQCLLDVILFISLCLFVAGFIVFKLIHLFIRNICSSRKQKQN